MGGSIDIMGVQRGAHKDGDDVCPGFVFKKPGGVQPDGTPIWGWNDADSASCARCKLRDIDHVIIRDHCQEAIQADREKFNRKKEREMQHQPPISRSGLASSTSSDPTTANPTNATSTASARFSYTDPYAAQMGVLELEPGVPDPLAISAYRQAEKEQSAARAARRAREEAESAAALAATKMAATGDMDVSDAAGLATASQAAADDENARFKAEVEKMVAEQLAKEREEKAAKANMTIQQMLASVSLDQYLPAFEEEGMEMSVLVQLAQTEDGKAAVDDALKELGVKSIGHRLKIFAALQ